MVLSGESQIYVGRKGEGACFLLLEGVLELGLGEEGTLLAGSGSCVAT